MWAWAGFSKPARDDRGDIAFTFIFTNRTAHVACAWRWGEITWAGRPWGARRPRAVLWGMVCVLSRTLPMPHLRLAIQHFWKGEWVMGFDVSHQQVGLNRVGVFLQTARTKGPTIQKAEGGRRRGPTSPGGGFRILLARMRRRGIRKFAGGVCGNWRRGLIGKFRTSG